MDKILKDMEELLEETKRTGEMLKNLKEKKIAVDEQLNNEYQEYVCQQIIKESGLKLARDIDYAVRNKQVLLQKYQLQKQHMNKMLQETQNIMLNRSN
uniref:Flagellar FliJ protein n=1 Tax=Strongyloides papillosus TaxID=174720 RepID=A0A0N5BYE7_STREA